MNSTILERVNLLNNRAVFKLLKSNWVYLLVFILITDHSIKYVLFAESITLKGLATFLVYPLFLVLSAVFRKRGFWAFSLTAIAQVGFLVTLHSQLDPRFYSYFTFTPNVGYTLLLGNPIITFLFGASMVIMHIDPFNANLFSGQITQTLAFTGLLILVKRVRFERDRYLQASITDRLTQVYNFSYILEKGQAMLDSGKQLRILLMDIDSFKQWNDQHGHITGNELLVFVANLLREAALRSQGFVGRLGGDEFIVLMEDNEDARATKSFIEDSLRERPFPYKDGLTEHIQLSIGELMSSSKEHATIEELLGTVDTMMYQVKQKRKQDRR